MNTFSIIVLIVAYIYHHRIE